MFVTAFVTNALRSRHYLTSQLSPDDMMNDFGNSQAAQFYRHEVQRTESREECFCTLGYQDRQGGASTQNFRLLIDLLLS